MDKTNKKYNEIITSLEGRGIMPDRAPSLTPMIEALKRLNFFQSPFWQKYSNDPHRVIIVAGTNGKGSVCATLEALINGAGETVGLYTSPHLEETTERIRLSGKDISREHFCIIHDEVQKLMRDLTLTHFEMLTAMAVWYFSSGQLIHPVDRMILEVGLGGIWDATNAVPHRFAVFTSLGLDHQNFLGNTIVDVAKNKFGVVTEGCEVIHKKFPKEILSLAQETKNKTNSHWTEADTLSFKVDQSFPDEPRWVVQSKWGDCEINLPGLRGVENTSLALKVFERLKLDDSRIRDSLTKVRWPGRMERLSVKNRRIYVSGDHNPQGTESLLELLPHYKYKKLHILLGIGKDKDFAQIIEKLASIPRSALYLTEPLFRGRKVEDYGVLRRHFEKVFTATKEALEYVFTQTKDEDLILITGSLYLVGEVKKILKAGASGTTQL